MPTTPRRYQEVWLNDVALSSVSPLVMIQQISEDEPRLNQKTALRPGGGAVLLSNQLERREITIAFAIREGYDFTVRQEVYSKVAAWCWDGGWLRLSDRPGQRIWVTPTTAPHLGRLREWNEEISMTFTALWFPFWSDVTPTRVTSTGTVSSANLTVGGNYMACLEMSITPTSSAFISGSIAVPGTNTLLGLTMGDDTVPAGETIVLSYDERHLMHIMHNDAERLSKRDGVSADDLLLKPGQVNTIEYSLSTECTIEFRARGVWA